MYTPHPLRLTLLAAVVLMAATAPLSGCNLLKNINLAAIGQALSPASPVPTAVVQQVPETTVDPHIQIQLLTVHVQGPTSLADGALIVGDRDAALTTPAATAAKGASTAAKTSFGVLAAAPLVEVPAENAFVGVRGYDYTAIEQLPNRYSDDSGQAYFKYVPARVAFFVDAEITHKGNTYTLMGLTRTPDVGLNSDVTVDIASTLVARELLRIWQMTNYAVSYKDLSPEDFDPLLAVLRSVLRNGLPADIPLDLSTVHAPSGVWSLDNDRKDGALVFLSKLAERQSDVNDEIDRIYKAVNFALCSCVDDTRIGLKRPDPL